MCNCMSCIQEEHREETLRLESLLEIAKSALKEIAEGEHPDEASDNAKTALEQISRLERD